MKTQLHAKKTMFLIMILITFSIYGQEATFEILSLTPNPATLSFADAGGLSADGLVATGYSDSDEGPQAFRWENGEIQGLGYFPGGDYSNATTVSYDGSVVIGTANHPDGTYEGFRWDVETGVLEGIGHLGMGYTEPRGTSADGSVIVGGSISDLGNEAFRWENGEMIGLGDFEGGEFLSYAYNTTADGSIIVGYGTTESGAVACKWEDGEMIDLGSLGEGGSYAHNITPDGSIIIGQSNNQAFRWENGVMESLEGLLPEWVQTSANGISADGSIIVGFAYDSDSNMEPFIWTEQTGVRKIQEILEIDYGLNLTDYTLLNASKVTHDEATIVIIGYAWGPNITMRAWRATIPYSFITLSSQDILSTQVKIYPNPATNLLFVEADSPIKLIEIFDLQGRKINEFILNTLKAEIQINNLTKGNYLVKVHSQNDIITKQIIKK